MALVKTHIPIIVIGSERLNKAIEEYSHLKAENPIIICDSEERKYLIEKGIPEKDIVSRWFSGDLRIHIREIVWIILRNGWVVGKILLVISGHKRSCNWFLKREVPVVKHYSVFLPIPIWEWEFVK